MSSWDGDTEHPCYYIILDNYPDHVGLRELLFCEAAGSSRGLLLARVKPRATTY